jgi:hypothetical protein
VYLYRSFAITSAGQPWSVTRHVPIAHVQVLAALDQHGVRQIEDLLVGIEVVWRGLVGRPGHAAKAW